jgi:hypothetical protein
MPVQLGIIGRPIRTPQGVLKRVVIEREKGNPVKEIAWIAGVFLTVTAFVFCVLWGMV